MPQPSPASVTLERTLERTGYLQALQEASTEEAESRVDNLKEMVSAARDYEVRETDASLPATSTRCRCVPRRMTKTALPTRASG